MENKEKPLLTICLPTYNQEKYVRQSVQSAFDQTYSPLEIVLSDDCSADRTFEIMREMVDAYRGPHRIVLNRNPRNMGLGAHAAKIWGELSSGLWLVGAAGDDISHPDRAQKIAETAMTHPKASCIWSGCTIIDGGGNIIDRGSKSGKTRVYADRIPVILGATVAYRRDVYETFGPIASQVRNEDVVMSLRSKLLGDFIRIDESLVDYRKHDSNLSGNFNDSRDRIEKMRSRLGYAHLQQLADLHLFQERHPERIREIAALRRKVEDNYWIANFLSSWHLYPDQRGFLLGRLLSSPGSIGIVLRRCRLRASEKMGLRR